MDITEKIKNKGKIKDWNKKKKEAQKMLKYFKQKYKKNSIRKWQAYILYHKPALQTRGIDYISHLFYLGYSGIPMRYIEKVVEEILDAFIYDVESSNLSKMKGGKK